MRCVLVSCCGLPAAGKTTFCRSLVTTPTFSRTFVEGESTAKGAQLGLDAFEGGAPGIRISHVCFDEFIDRARRRRRRGSSENNSPSSSLLHLDPPAVTGASPHSSHVASGVKMRPQQATEHRQGRSDEQAGEQLQGCTTATNGEAAAAYSPRLPGGESIGDGIGESHADETPQQHGARLAAPAEGDEDDARCWREGRRAALAEIEALAARHGGSVDPATAVPPAAESATAPALRKREVERFPVSSPSDARVIVLADDNMHLRSMRREVFSTARKCAFYRVPAADFP